MENNRNLPDPAEAREVLADIERAEHAVRDVPWPIWLYAFNAVTLLALPATLLLPDYYSASAILLILAQISVNVWAGRHYTIPWAIPSDMTFRICCYIAVALSVSPFLLDIFTDPTWHVGIAGAIAAPLYLLGCLFHHRNATR